VGWIGLRGRIGRYATFVLALGVDLHLPECRSLKAKRSVLRPLLEALRRPPAVAAAEVADQDKWQRARLGIVAVAASVTQADELIDAAERVLWTRPDVQVLAVERSWMDEG